MQDIMSRLRQRAQHAILLGHSNAAADMEEAARDIEQLREALRSSRIAIVRDDSPPHAVAIINAALAASK